MSDPFFSITRFNEATSTNELIKQAIRSGEPEGCVVTSLVQTGGYGRQGRPWLSPLGGLYFSLLLSPQEQGIEPSELATLSLVLSLAVREALYKGSDPNGDRRSLMVKWPNDIKCGDQKICGISLEVVGTSVCVGVGINVFRPAIESEVGGKNTPVYLSEMVEDAPASFSEQYLDQVLECVLDHIHPSYDRWLTAGFAAFVEDYNLVLAHKQEHVTIESMAQAQLHSGIIQGVDPLGRLLLKTEKDDIIPISSGEVYLL